VTIELFQIAQMVELAIWVKVSALKMRPEEAKRKIWWVRVCLAGTVTLYSGVNLFEASNLHYIVTNEEPSKWRVTMMDTITPANYFSVSIGLVISAIYLLINIHMYFEKQLKDEARRIKVIFLVLTVSYVSRVVVYILTSARLIEHYWIVYLVMYTFWDILPLSLIMFYHYNNFKAQEKTKKRERAIQEREEQAVQARLLASSSI